MSGREKATVAFSDRRLAVLWSRAVAIAEFVCSDELTVQLDLDRIEEKPFLFVCETEGKEKSGLNWPSRMNIDTITMTRSSLLIPFC